MSVWIDKASTGIFDTGIQENPNNSAFSYNQSDVIMRLGRTYLGPNLSYK
jgi:hypothetical protein